MLDKENNIVRSYKRSFINYFSLGYDARVGFGFEKSRSGNRCCNKCIYFWEGCKKNCCRKTIPVNSFFDSFHAVDPAEEEARKKKEQEEQIAKSAENKEVLTDYMNDSEAYYDKVVRRKSKVYFKSGHEKRNNSMNNRKSSVDKKRK